MNRNTALVAFRYRNYRLLWLGQLVSFSGSMMQNAAILWHVSLLVPDDQKALALGGVGLVRLVPIIAFAMVGGVMADAVDRRRLMLFTQTAIALVAATLCVLTFQGRITVGWLYLLTALNASAGAFDGPARQSLIPNLVSREHLPSAISLNTIMFELASVFGPLIGGALIATTDLGWVYALNAVSYTAVIGALALMQGVSRQGGGPAAEVSVRAAVEGLRFVFRAPLIRSTMLLDFFANVFASAVALLPIFAQDILRVGAQGYGWLYSAPSVGALTASIIMVRLADRIERRGIVLLWAVSTYAIATIVFGVSRNFYLTWLCLAVTGAADIVGTVLRNIIRQLATPDHLRGRMTSVNMIFFAGGPQMGELEAGLVANLIGAPLSVISGGLGALLTTLYIGASTPALRAHRRDDPAAALQAQGAAAD